MDDRVTFDDASDTIADVLYGRAVRGDDQSFMCFMRLACSSGNVWRKWKSFPPQQPLTARLQELNRLAALKRSLVGTRGVRTPNDVHRILSRNGLLRPGNELTPSRDFLKRAFAVVAGCPKYYFTSKFCGDMGAYRSDEGFDEFVRDNPLCYRAMQTLGLVQADGTLDDLAWYGSTFDGQILKTALRESNLIRGDIPCTVYAEHFRSKCALADVLMESGTPYSLDWLVRTIPKRYLPNALREEHFTMDKDVTWWFKHVPKDVLPYALLKSGHLDACDVVSLVEDRPLNKEIKFRFLLHRGMLKVTERQDEAWYGKVFGKFAKALNQARKGAGREPYKPWLTRIGYVSAYSNSYVNIE